MSFINNHFTASESDHSVIDRAGSENATYVYTSGVLSSINFTNSDNFTSNTKVMTYTNGLLTTIIHAFTYMTQVWTVTSTLIYTNDVLTGKTVSVVKV